MAINPIIRAQIKTFREMNPHEEMNDSEFFEIMSMFSIENGVLGENIDPFKAHLKGDEFGIDGVAISIQGKLCTDVDEAAEVLSIGKTTPLNSIFINQKSQIALIMVRFQNSLMLYMISLLNKS
jgi:hypothetical protein